MPAMGHKRHPAAVASDEPYLQIGEVAERTGGTQRTLRFYEEKELLMQLRAQYRPEAAVSQKKAQLLRAIEVTERQCDLIRQKVDGLTEMQSKMEERLAPHRRWPQQF